MSVNINGTTGVSLLQQAAVDEKEILQIGDYGFGGAAVTVNAGSANSILVSGLYKLSASVTDTPVPGVECYCEVVGDATVGYCKQRATIRGTATPLVYERLQIADVWTNWFLAYNRSTVLGPVSQSAGVPTGSIIERGSNANGEYVKFADGTLICEVEIPTTLTSGGTTATFPATFVNSDYGFSLTVGSNAAYFATGATRTTTSLQVYAWSTSGVQSNRSLFLTAIGRWF